MEDQPIKKVKKVRKKAKTSKVKTHALSSRRRLAVKGTDPDMVYRHVRKEDDGVEFRKQDGWEQVQKGGKVTGALETHDLILMEISKDLHDEIKNIPGERSRRRIQASKGIGQGGIEEFDKTRITRDSVQEDLQNSQEDDIIFE